MATWPRLAVTIILFGTCLGSTFAWTYDGKEGPEEWAQRYPQCGEQSQSPIDIQTSAAVAKYFAPFQFEHYDSIALASILENGHTVVLTLPDDYPMNQRPSVVGGGLSSPYIFQQLHFHWGNNDTHGSEHTIDKNPYAAEIHLVHYNSKYGDYSEALWHSDGLAVLAVFIQVSVANNTALEPLITHLREVPHKYDKTRIPETLNFHHILPKSTEDFYRYSGSLTTPPCNEIVTWTVFRTPVPLSSIQLSEFRLLTNEEDRPLVNNDRPVQPVHSRTVFASSGAVSRIQSIMTTVICLTVIMKLGSH